MPKQQSAYERTLTPEDKLLDKYYQSKRPKTRGEFIVQMVRLLKTINKAPNKYRLPYRKPHIQ